MRKIVYFIAVAAIVTCFSSCDHFKKHFEANKKDTSTSFDLENARTTINEDNKKFGEEFSRGDATALGAHYAVDAESLPPNGEPVKGRDVIASMWAGTIKMGMKSFTATTTDLTGDDEVLAEQGNYQIAAANNQVVDKGKYIVIWKKEEGKWKIHRDIWNTSMASTGGK